MSEPPVMSINEHGVPSLDEIETRAQWIANQASVYPEDLQREIYKSMKAIASDAGLRIYALEQRIRDLERQAGHVGTPTYEPGQRDGSEWEPVGHMDARVTCLFDDETLVPEVSVTNDRLSLTDDVIGHIYLVLPSYLRIFRRARSEEATDA